MGKSLPLWDSLFISYAQPTKLSICVGTGWPTEVAAEAEIMCCFPPECMSTFQSTNLLDVIGSQEKEYVDQDAKEIIARW